MDSKASVLSNRKFNLNFKRSLFLVVLSVIGLLSITGCGSNKASTELPKDFIREFIAKHETMVDQSLVYYYVKPDQPEIAEQINITCRINESKGCLEVLRNAIFDFSELQIELVDKKENYVNDEPVLFVKVAIKGNYKMQLPEETRTIKANEILVLQLARSEWKVTNTNNPWS